MLENPANVFRKSLAHSAYHCHVRSASPKDRSRPLRCVPGTDVGCHPGGWKPSGGFFIKKAEPRIATRYEQPRIPNVAGSPTDGISRCAIGAVTRAPAPNPATASPVIMPRLSGNHLMSVATGTM